MENIFHNSNKGQTAKILLQLARNAKIEYGIELSTKKPLIQYGDVFIFLGYLTLHRDRLQDILSFMAQFRNSVSLAYDGHSHLRIRISGTDEGLIKFN